ncbi:activity-regulated cytoskeleton associated protein 1-like [Achroia grisella]|uniref:activity-regulated cytoskeleton associated protein 1-like n=1 Tax=Achroia grisella TaxID=688607 RepID=UPI0027D2AF4C|nr:activity-regulated cytoskeleton associated protein 1-like [Achroia grisella]
MSIPDTIALKGLAMLLEGDAAVWFRGIRTSITSWEEAMSRLRAMLYAAATHKVFRDIFKSEQDADRTEVFVARLRALLTTLPYVLEERVQLDIIYGLLNRSIRKRVTRESVTTIEELIYKARNVEEALSEANKLSSKSSSTVTQSARESISRAHCAPTARAITPFLTMRVHPPKRSVPPLRR